MAAPRKYQHAERGADPLGSGAQGLVHGGGLPDRFSHFLHRGWGVR
jgi:hypothetical protein